MCANRTANSTYKLCRASSYFGISADFRIFNFTDAGTTCSRQTLGVSAAENMTNLPDTNNYYSFFKNHSVDEVFNLLVKFGWTGHKSTWDNCILTDNLSEMELYSCDGGVLLNGRLANGLTKYTDIVKLFKDKGACFSAELYDDNKNLIISDDFLTSTNT